MKCWLRKKGLEIRDQKERRREEKKKENMKSYYRVVGKRKHQGLKKSKRMCVKISAWER